MTTMEMIRWYGLIQYNKDNGGPSYNKDTGRYETTNIHSGWRRINQTEDSVIKYVTQNSNIRNAFV